jgi:hypothetical protein
VKVKPLIPAVAHYNAALYHDGMDTNHRTHWRGTKIHCDNCPKTWASDHEYRANDEPCEYEDRISQPELAQMLGITQGTLRAYVSRGQIQPPNGHTLGRPWWWDSVATAITESRKH